MVAIGQVLGQKFWCGILPLLLTPCLIPAEKILEKYTANKRYRIYTLCSLSGFVLGAGNTPEPSSGNVLRSKRLLEGNDAQSLSDVPQKTQFALNEVLSRYNG